MKVPDWLQNLNFAFSRKKDGQMSFKRDSPDAIIRNRRTFLHNHNLQLQSIVAAELVHGGNVALVNTSHRGRGAATRNWIPQVDGLITTSPDVLLFTTHADCTPLILYDQKHRVLAQAHAGWRSLRSGIVDNLVNKMLQISGDSPAEINAWIGPCIHVCCYEVGREVSTQFPETVVRTVNSSMYLDMNQFILQKMSESGIHSNQITDSGVCTSCDKRFSSYRRDKQGFHAMACISGLKQD